MVAIIIINKAMPHFFERDICHGDDMNSRWEWDAGREKGRGNGWGEGDEEGLAEFGWLVWMDHFWFFGFFWCGQHFFLLKHICSPTHSDISPSKKNNFSTYRVTMCMVIQRAGCDIES